jgi:hypothetical protein
MPNGPFTLSSVFLSFSFVQPFIGIRSNITVSIPMVGNVIGRWTSHTQSVTRLHAGRTIAHNMIRLDKPQTAQPIISNTKPQRSSFSSFKMSHYINYAQQKL